MTRSLLVTLALSLGAAPLAFGQIGGFDIFYDVSWDWESRASTFSGQSTFSLGLRSSIDPANEDVVLELVPPDPVVPPDPIKWQLFMPAGCFVLSRSGQFRLEDFLGCRAQLMLFIADGTTRDLSDQIRGLEADFKPPTGNQTDWRYRFVLDTVNGQTLPPNPIGGFTRFMVGDDTYEAIHIELSWTGASPPDDG